MNLRQQAFAYCACGPFTKDKQTLQKTKKTRYSRYIFHNELDKACFEYDIAYGHLKDLARRTASDKILHNKEFGIAKDPKYDGYQKGLASMFYKFFDKKLLVAVLKMGICQTGNQQKNYTNQLSENSRKQKYNNVSYADLADKQLISRLSK